MLAKRIIPCLDVRDGMTVKGVNFVNIVEVGDPVELGEYYANEGADELVFLDITATNEKRKTMLQWVKKVAAKLNIPFTVGGGISSLEDVSALLDAGADKISINTAAFKNPDLINELSLHFGSQCIVLAVDTKYENGDSFVYLNGGRQASGKLTLPWIKEGVDRGAGEILLTSINHDGTKNGFAIGLTRQVSEMVNVPVIASGGAGTVAHFADVFTEGKADAALAAGIFHRKEVTIGDVKNYLIKQNIPTRTI